MDAHYNAVWISDTHLCSRGCQLEHLLRFIRRVRCRYLYLVGDILDLWVFRRRRYWPQELNNVLRSLLGQTKHGTQVIYICGNHDEGLRQFAGSTFGNIGLYTQAVHTTADGRRFLVLHGHEVDPVMQYRRWLSRLCASVYDYSVSLERILNRLWQALGLSPFYLSGPIKRRVENGVKPIKAYELALARHARQFGADGVICGHTHAPAIKEIEGTLYCNAGDWIDSCTALVEKADGSLELLRWLDEPESAEDPASEPRHARQPDRHVLLVR
ncbi:MAG: UDP-2,3-diacylglucosamine diphosphatase [Planctomycetota bacterium]